MCLILFAWCAHPVYRLVVAANRDEFYSRPTAPMQWWDNGVLAGRDLEAGGTWMGVTKTGRFAAVTNVREPGRTVPDARSRGDLVADYLVSQDDPNAYSRQVDGLRYNGFNLLTGDGAQLWWSSNRAPAPQRIDPGVHGVSNALLDTPWPKVTGGLAAFADALATDDGTVGPDAYFAVLADRSRARDADLPHTGVPPRLERRLSPRFVAMRRYGTRAGTVLRVRQDGSFDIAERTFRGRRSETVTFSHY